LASHSVWRDYAPVLTCAVTYAIAVVCARIAFEDGSNASTVVTMRCVFAMAAVGVAIRFGNTPDRSTPRDRRLILWLGVLFAINVYAFYKAIELLRIPLAILIFYVYPLMTGVIAVAAGTERLSAPMLGFCLLSLAGLALATGASPEALDPLGAGLALFAGVVVALTLVVTTRQVSHVDPYRRTFWMMVSTAAVLAVATLGAGTFQWPKSGAGSAAIAGVCVFYAIGVVGLYTSATRIGPIRTAVMMNLEPVLAIAMSTVLLRQGLTGLQYAGGALVIAGVIGVQLARRPAAPAR
jgi:probable blue pigment (indigoidine) exporter